MDDTELKVAALTKQVAEGDEQAFAKFYETLNPYVTKNVTRVLSRYSQPSILQDERDNIIQETWATVWAHRKQLSSESVYEFIILKLYEVIKYYHFPAETRNSPLSAANTIEDKRSPRGWQFELPDIESLVLSLPPVERTAFTLTAIEGYSYIEAAQTMDVSLNSLARYLSRSRQHFRSAMGSRYEAFERDTKSLKEKIAAPPEFIDKAVIEVTVDFQKQLEEISVADTQLFQLLPRQFEELIAEIWDRFGYHVELTKRTRDGGRDIIAVRKAETDMKFLIECKRYAADNKVGISIVRALYGVKTDERATKAILATTSTFSETAKEFVTRHKWELEARDRDGVVEWVKRARHMTRQRKSGLWVPSWIDLTKG